MCVKPSGHLAASVSVLSLWTLEWNKSNSETHGCHHFHSWKSRVLSPRLRALCVKPSGFFVVSGLVRSFGPWSGISQTLRFTVLVLVIYIYVLILTSEEVRVRFAPAGDVATAIVRPPPGPPPYPYGFNLQRSSCTCCSRRRRM